MSEPTSDRYLLAPQHLRLFGFLLDYLIVIAGLKLAEQVLLGDGWDLRLAAHPPTVFPLWWLLTVPVLFIVRDVLGTSPGKWVTGLSVRRYDRPSEHPVVWKRLARNLSLLLLPIDVYSVFRDPHMRRYGDRWFGTVVVVRRPEIGVVTRAFGLGILFLGFVLMALLTTSWNLHRTAAYQLAHSSIMTQSVLVTYLGEPVHVDGSPSMELRVDQGMALFLFHAKGQQHEADVRVRLVMQRTPVSWTVGSIDMVNPEAQQPPLVRDAPAKTSP